MLPVPIHQGQARGAGFALSAISSLVWGVKKRPIKKQRDGRGLGLRFVRLGRVGPGQGLRQLGLSWVRWGQVESGRVGSGWVGSGWVRSCRVRWLGCVGLGRVGLDWVGWLDAFLAGRGVIFYNDDEGINNHKDER